MGRITTVSLFVAICFIGATYGAECTSGPGYRFPITCPGLLDPTDKYCCEISGSFRCCNEEEFSRQEEYNDETKPVALRYKRGYLSSWESTYSNTVTTISVGAIIGYCILAIMPLGIICCCCCCCACCPCYHWCHPNSSTSVTIVQPSLGGYPPAGNSGQINVCANISQNPPPAQYAPPQNPPPQYAPPQYAAPSDCDANFI